MTTPTTVSMPTYVSSKPLLWAALLAALASVVGNIIVLLIGQYLFNVSFLMPAPGALEQQPLGIGHVALFSSVPALAAAGLLLILGRYTARPLRMFWIVASIVLLVSFIPDFLLPVDTGTMIGLLVMHVVSAVTIVGVLTNAGAGKEPASKERF